MFPRWKEEWTIRENDSINISALISSPLAITDKEGIYIWFIDCNSKEKLSMLLRKRGHHKHRAYVVSCVTLMSNDKRIPFSAMVNWQRIVANVWETKIFMWVLGHLTKFPFKQKPQGVFYEGFLLKLLWWKVLCCFWTFVRLKVFSTARHCFCVSPVKILNKVRHIKQGRFCHIVPEKLLCTLL